MNELELGLSSMKSYNAIKYALNGVELHDLQCIDVMKMLASKKAIVSYVTGLGKTVLAAATMRLLWNEDPTRKFIFFGKFDQLSQTPAKLEAMCGRKVISSFASAKSIQELFSKQYENYSILFLTHDTLHKDSIMNDLFQHRTEYTGIFIDEAHELSNTGVAMASSIMAGVARQFEYCYALTATPITTSVKQLAKLANVVDAKRFPDAKRLERQLASGSFRIEQEPCFFINRSRAEFGSKTDYHGIVEFVEPLPHQRVSCGGSRMFELCKGDGAYPQAEALVRLIRQRESRRGLVYVNQHSVRNWILPFLNQAGIRYECINGTTPLQERTRIMKQFNDDCALDVVLTSVTTALDLDCDYVIFYEFTVDVKQMIGRAHRGLGDKSLDVIFVVTDESSEVDYFYDNIYSVSMTIKEILNQDYSEIEDVNQELRGRYNVEN